jgi:hypothetical protein
VDQLSTSVAGITSWQMHGYGKKNTTIKGYERPIQKAKGWLDERRGNGKVGSTKGEETAKGRRKKEADISSHFYEIRDHNYGNEFNNFIASFTVDSTLVTCLVSIQP